MPIHIFAMKMNSEYHFRAKGDRYQDIKGWLLNDLTQRLPD